MPSAQTSPMTSKTSRDKRIRTVKLRRAQSELQCICKGNSDANQILKEKKTMRDRHSGNVMERETPVQDPPVESQTEQVVETPVAETATQVVEPTLEQKFALLQAELTALKSVVPKNHKPGIPKATKYVRLGALDTFGKVPQQQRDIAAILEKEMPVGEEFTEAQVFEIVTKRAVDFASLRGSKQDPTYIFRYYRGLKNDGTHSGFVGRKFLRAA